MKKQYRYPTKFLIIFIFLTFIYSCKKDDRPDSMTDGDGNVYSSITIGDQIWLKENLKTTKYNDGSQIALIRDVVKWSTAYNPAYSWYENDSINNKDTYGALYNLFAVNNKLLCPVGWHVPDNSEWTSMLNFLGGESVSGNLLKETGTAHWRETNSSVTNSTSFSALPGGYRGRDGYFLYKSSYGYFWSSGNSTNTICLGYESGQVFSGQNSANHGFSVRCIKDK